MNKANPPQNREKKTCSHRNLQLNGYSSHNCQILGNPNNLQNETDKYKIPLKI